MQTNMGLLRATFLLLLFLGIGWGQSLPSRRSGTMLDRRQADDFDGEFPKEVYRGETKRTPADVERDGGFVSRGLQKQRAGTALSAMELDLGSSLFHHASGDDTASFTRYVSTSTDPGVALTFAVDDDAPTQKGYLYKIHADDRFLDLNRSLGKYSPYPGQKEHAAIEFIRYEQIEGWYEVTYEKHFSEPQIGKESQDKLRRGAFGHFKKNAKFDKSRFHNLRGRGRVPQLAGFPAISPAWQEVPWKAFKTQAVDKNLNAVIDSLCGGRLRARRGLGCTGRPGGQQGIDGSGPKRPSTGSKGKPRAEKADGGGRKASEAKGPVGAAKGKSRTGEPVRNAGTGPKYQSTGVRLTKETARVAAFVLVLPYARDLLEAIKQWDHPIGHAVKWFDDVMAAFQESIGGSQRQDIYGNDLKASLICALKGGRAEDTIVGRKSNICLAVADEFKEELRRDLDEGKLDQDIVMCEEAETYRGGSPHAWEETKRFCDALHRTDEYAERRLQQGINELLDVCDGYALKAPEDRDLAAKLDGGCTALQRGVRRIEKGDKAMAVTEGIPKITVGSCKCDAYHLPPDGHCHSLCLASFALSGHAIPARRPPSGSTSTLDPVPTPKLGPALQEPVEENCADETGSIPCGGRQTAKDRETGRAACGVCGFAWDPEGGKCRNRKGVLLWPQKISPPTDKCLQSLGERPCGGGRQTKADFRRGFTICTVCRLTWDPRAGVCKRMEGDVVVWPPRPKA
ncbi:hypothetical protein RJ55_00496 [Drechmeria coniospora]|nr:hypothetical protein RJ55_00496 [Drechmeria coniospora]